MSAFFRGRGQKLGKKVMTYNYKRGADMERGGVCDKIAKKCADVVYGRPTISDTTFFSFRKKKNIYHIVHLNVHL